MFFTDPEKELDFRNFNVKECDVVLCERSEIQYFIETHHYSHNINGCITDYCFKLLYRGVMIGAAFFGKMAMAGQWKRFSDNPDDVTELRRLCCIDEAPHNTESYFISKMLRYLKNNTDLRVVVSYADLEEGHIGTIYKASNFTLIGKSPAGSVIMYNGKKYHDKAIRTKYKDKLKPFAQELKDALERGDAVYHKTKGKNTYVYYLRDKRNRANSNN